MSFEQILHRERPWAQIASLAMILAFFTLACLLIRYVTGPVIAIPLAVRASYQDADEQLVSTAEEAAQAPRAQMAAEQALAPQSAKGPGTPEQSTDEPTPDQRTASEQRTFKSRRALETINPSELLRRAAAPPANLPR